MAQTALSDADRVRLEDEFGRFVGRETVDAIGYFGGVPPTDDDFRSRAVFTSVALCRRALRRCETVNDVHALFGAPGDYGYETGLGQVLQQLYARSRT